MGPCNFDRSVSLGHLTFGPSFVASDRIHVHWLNNPSPNTISSLFPTNNASHPGVFAVYTQKFDSKEVRAIAISSDGDVTLEEILYQSPVIDIET